MKSLTENNFAEEISGGNWLVQFWATWCGPCADAKHLKQYESAAGGVRTGRVNVEENQELAASFSIIVVPTYLFFRHGVLVKRLVGLQDKESLLAILPTEPV